MLKRFVAVNRSASDFLLEKFPSIFGAPSYLDELLGRINASIEKLQPRRIIEIGGIDRPLLSKSQSYEYVGVDIEEKENCSNVYDAFIVQTIEQPLDRTAPLVISITLLEHVPDNRSAIQSIAAALEPGGETHHYLPSKWHPYSIALRIVGPTLQKKLIAVLRPAAADVTGYPAYFDHCDAPAMRRLFAEAGLESVETKAFYRAADYFAFFTPAFVLVTLFENACDALGLEILASGFVISARKPASA